MVRLPGQISRTSSAPNIVQHSAPSIELWCLEVWDKLAGDEGAGTRTVFKASQKILVVNSLLWRDYFSVSLLKLRVTHLCLAISAFPVSQVLNWLLWNNLSSPCLVTRIGTYNLVVKWIGISYDILFTCSGSLNKLNYLEPAVGTKYAGILLLFAHTAFAAFFPL